MSGGGQGPSGTSGNGGAEFARNQHVDGAGQFGAQPGKAFHARKHFGRAQVGKQAQRLAQAEDRLFGAQVPFQIVALEIAHRAEQDRIAFAGGLQRGFGQRMAMLAPGGCTDIALDQFHSFKLQRFEYLPASCVTSGPIPSPANTAIFISLSSMVRGAGMAALPGPMAVARACLPINTGPGLQAGNPLRRDGQQSARNHRLAATLQQAHPQVMRRLQAAMPGPPVDAGRQPGCVPDCGKVIAPTGCEALRKLNRKREKIDD